MTIAIQFLVLFPLASGVDVPKSSSRPVIEGDAGLLEALRAAQLTNKTLFQRGRLRATVHSTWRGQGVKTVDVSADVTWDGPNTYWDYQLKESLAPARPGMGKPSAVPGRMIERPDGLLTYFPRGGYAEIVRENRATYREELKLRPDQIWFRIEGVRDWSDLIGPTSHFPQNRVQKYVVARDGADLVTIDRYLNNGSRFTVVGSLLRGGNVVRYEGVDANGKKSREGSYEWREYDEGQFCLKAYSFTRYRAGEAEPLRQFRLEITNFDPEPTISRDRFEMSSLAVEAGTTVQELYADSKKDRTYTHGRGPEGVKESKLDELSEKVRERGFAAPNRD